MARSIRWIRRGRPLPGVVLGAWVLGAGLLTPTVLAESAEEALGRAVREGDVDEVRRLLASGVDTNPPGPTAALPLHQAVTRGFPDIVELLLEAGAELTGPYGGGGYLELASRSRDPEVQLALHRLLVDAGATVEPLTSEVLRRWVDEGDHELLKVVTEALHSGFNRERQGGCPLTLAIRRQDAALLRRLLEHGLDANDSCGNHTALTYAADSGWVLAVEALIAVGADPARANKQGHTPLIVAARRRQTEAARALIRGGADMNQLGGQGPPDPRRIGSPLLSAVESKGLEMVRLLVENGADPRKTDDIALRWPAGVAVEENAPEILDYLLEHGATVGDALKAARVPCSLAIVRTLLAHGLEPDQPPKNAALPRFARCKLEVVEPLLVAAADLDSTDPAGRTALMLATEAGRLELVERLLEMRARVDAQDEEGRTAVFSAAGRPGGLDYLEILYRAGADLGHVDRRGGNALVEAARNTRFLEASFLLRRGVEEVVDPEKGLALYQLFGGRWRPSRADLEEPKLELRAPSLWRLHAHDPSTSPVLVTGSTGLRWDLRLEVRRTGIEQNLEDVDPASLSSASSSETSWREIRGVRLPMARGGALEVDDSGRVELTMAVPIPGDLLRLRASGPPKVEALLLWSLEFLAESTLGGSMPEDELATGAPMPEARDPGRLQGHPNRLVLPVLLAVTLILGSLVIGLWWMIRRFLS